MRTQTTCQAAATAAVAVGTTYTTWVSRVGSRVKKRNQKMQVEFDFNGIRSEEDEKKKRFHYFKP